MIESAATFSSWSRPTIAHRPIALDPARTSRKRVSERKELRSPSSTTAFTPDDYDTQDLPRHGARPRKFGTIREMRGADPIDDGRRTYLPLSTLRRSSDNADILRDGRIPTSEEGLDLQGAHTRGTVTRRSRSVTLLPARRSGDHRVNIGLEFGPRGLHEKFYLRLAATRVPWAHHQVGFGPGPQPSGENTLDSVALMEADNTSSARRPIFGSEGRSCSLCCHRGRLELTHPSEGDGPSPHLSAYVPRVQGRGPLRPRRMVSRANGLSRRVRRACARRTAVRSPPSRRQTNIRPPVGLTAEKPSLRHLELTNIGIPIR